MHFEDVPIVALATFVVLVLVFGYLCGLRYLVQYQVTGTHLKIKLLGVFSVRNIRLDSIVEARTIDGWKDTLPFSKEFRLPFLIAERWPSYVFQMRGVFIRRRTGIVRYFILSPRNPEELVEQIALSREARV